VAAFALKEATLIREISTECSLRTYPTLLRATRLEQLAKLFSFCLTEITLGHNNQTYKYYSESLWLTGSVHRPEF
jgi:hypothetical protein